MANLKKTAAPVQTPQKRADFSAKASLFRIFDPPAMAANTAPSLDKSLGMLDLVSVKAALPP
jgi:hypothetical protein